MATCEICKGTSFVQCPRCAGTGRIGKDVFTPSVKCGNCHGSGVIKCVTCSSTGYIKEGMQEYIKSLSNANKIPYELEKEINYFDQHFDELLRRYNSKYIAIKNQEVIAVGDSYGEVSEKVRKSNYRKEKCVLIRKVTKERRIHFVPFPLS